MKTKTTTLSPRKANTYNKLCSLRRDNKDFGSSSILVSEDHISVWGYGDNGYVSINKHDFNRMIDWYNKEQL